LLSTKNQSLSSEALQARSIALLIVVAEYQKKWSYTQASEKATRIAISAQKSRKTRKIFSLRKACEKYVTTDPIKAETILNAL
jgi:hypothetical protein